MSADRVRSALNGLCEREAGESLRDEELAGTKYAEHDNAIGTFTTRLATATRGLVGLAPKHHPGTIRMPVEVTARLNELARSA